MNQELLRQDLRKLHDELRSINSLDESEQQLLRTLKSDIEALLAKEDDNLRPDDDSRERVSGALAQIEASHPRLTLIMQQMVDSLAYLGI